jgi:hypothetical protein
MTLTETDAIEVEAPSFTVGDFIDYIGCGPSLGDTLRAIDRHNLEHVWVVIDGVSLYYHLGRDFLNAFSHDIVIEKVGAGCIAWDGSDWEYSSERHLHTTEDIVAVRWDCNDAFAAYTAEQGDEE